MELTTRVDRLDATMAELASALTRPTDAQTRTEERATTEMLRIAWKVGDDLSPSFIEFRRLPSPPPA
ncbi:MAG TPA: hypothetical protein VNM48_17960 [Chloroflexota bacterium]|nr:hypothetical protein [Chloroflexota bacterium]